MVDCNRPARAGLPPYSRGAPKPPMIRRISLLLLVALAFALPANGTTFASRPEQAPAAPAAAATVNVAIQAGHWKSNELPDALARLRTSTGAYGGGRSESQVTLDIAQRAARLLRAKGLTVEVLPATVPT